MNEIKRIGILTSGGDASGMNQFIANFNHYLDKNKYELIMIKNGLQGLYDNDFCKYDNKYINACSLQAGSMIYASRFLLLKQEEQKQKIIEKFKQNLSLHRIDCLIVLGGNGTLIATINILKTIINVIFIPCSIDNDLNYTQYSLGFDSALNAAISNINQIYASVKTYHQILIAEIMGNHNLELSINVCLATNADYVIVDNKLSLDEIATLIAHKIKNDQSLLIILSELNYSHEQLNTLCSMLQEKYNKKTKLHIVGYLQRGANPSAFDLSLATQFSLHTLSCIKNNQFNIALAYKDKKVFNCQLNESLLNQENINNYQCIITKINKGEI